VKRELGTNLIINWKYFSLEQVNSQQGPRWKIWKQPGDYSSRGLLAFRAAEAAWRQGEAAFLSFHLALLKAKHEDERDIADINVLTAVAGSAGLEISRFEKDMSDRQLLNRLAEDHAYAVTTLGVFGTPTLVFPEKQAIFLKMSPPPPPDECLPVFSELYHLTYRRRGIRELKRP